MNSSMLLYLSGRNKVFWIDEDTCVTDTNGGIPSPPAGSADWYVNWEVNFGTVSMRIISIHVCL